MTRRLAAAFQEINLMSVSLSPLLRSIVVMLSSDVS